VILKNVVRAVEMLDVELAAAMGVYEDEHSMPWAYRVMAQVRFSLQVRQN
jgi:hypothetical protein